MQAPSSYHLEIAELLVILTIIKRCQSSLPSDGMKYHPSFDDIIGSEDLDGKKFELLGQFCRYEEVTSWSVECFCAAEDAELLERYMGDLNQWWEVFKKTPAATLVHMARLATNLRAKIFLPKELEGDNIPAKGSVERVKAYSDVIAFLEKLSLQLGHLKAINKQLITPLPADPSDTSDGIISRRLNEIEAKIHNLQDTQRKVRKEIPGLRDLLPINEKVKIAVSIIVDEWFSEQKANFPVDNSRGYVADALRLFEEGIKPTLAAAQEAKEKCYDEIITARLAKMSLNPCRPLNPVPSTIPLASATSTMNQISVADGASFALQSTISGAVTIQDEDVDMVIMNS